MGKETKVSPYRFCHVPYCHARKTTDTELTLHLFPKNEKLRKEWIKAVKIVNPGRFNFVCSRHFRKDDYIIKVNPDSKKGSLKKTAIPSRNLPICSLETNGVFKRNITDSCEETSKSFLLHSCSNRIKPTSTSFIVCQPDKTTKGIQDICIQTQVTYENQETQTNSVEKKSILLQTDSENDNFPRPGVISIGVQADEMILHKELVNLTDMLQTEEQMILLTGCDMVSLDRLIKNMNRIEKKEGWSVKTTLSLKDKIILSLIRLRFNWSYAVLSALFQVNSITVVRSFKSTFHGFKTLMKEAEEMNGPILCKSVNRSLNENHFVLKLLNVVGTLDVQ